MKSFKAAAILLFGLIPAIAAAQSQPNLANMPAGTVIGRSQIGPGPAQAIPLAQFKTINGNVVGPASTTIGHLPLWSNAFGTQQSDFAGTSGGLLYFNSSGGAATSALLTHYGVLIGGGAGAAPASVAVGTNNQALMGNTGAAPGFRALTGADLPNPSATTLGGVESITSLTHNWIAYIDTFGVPHQSQPSFSDISGSVAGSQMPVPGASSLGGVFSKSCVSGGQFVQTINTDGSVNCVTPAGGGNVSNSGTPTANQFAQWINSTQVQGVSGPWTLLNTLTASTSASLSDTTHFTSSYNDYEIVFENLVPATTSVSAELQVHSGGSFQATSYLASAYIQASANTPTTYMPLSLSADVTSGSPGLSGILLMTGFNIASTPKWWTGQAAYATRYAPAMIGGYWNSASAIDGFQFLFSSGNIASGTIKIYGRL